MGIGNELRQARQQAGLTAQHIADRTKVKLEKIEALEQEAFEYLPAGIYLDGIVRAYAQEIGLDPAAAVAQLHAETFSLDGHAVSFSSQPSSPPNIEIVAVGERDPLAHFPAEAEVPVAA